MVISTAPARIVAEQRRVDVPNGLGLGARRAATGVRHELVVVRQLRFHGSWLQMWLQMWLHGGTVVTRWLHSGYALPRILVAAQRCPPSSELGDFN